MSFTSDDLIEIYAKMVKDTDKYMTLTSDKGRRLLADTRSYYIMNNHIQDYGISSIGTIKNCFGENFPT
jgi:hypothetical protein